MQSIDHDILPLVQREQLHIVSKFPQYSGVLQTLLAEFSIRFREELGTFDQSIDFCRRVQSMLTEHDLPDELVVEINLSRRRILFEIIQNGLTNNNLAGNEPIRFQDQFPIANNGRKNQKKSSERTNDEYEEIIRIQNYDILRLATSLGVDAAADVLCSLRQIGDDERAGITSFISAYLGRCQRPVGLEGGDFLSYPQAVLDVPSVRAVAMRVLLQDIYATLLACGVDDPERQQEVRAQAPNIVLEHLSQMATNVGVTSPSIHAGLFMELANFIQRSCSQMHPNSLVTTLIEQGRNCPFPALRQSIAIQLLKERRKLYVGFEPGRGKSPIPIYLFEQLRQDGKQPRMLYLAPLPVVQELPNRIRPDSAPQPTRDCYYVDPEEAPTLGVIDRALKNEQLAEIIQDREIVFGPYSMIHSQRNINENSEEETEAEVEAEVVRIIDKLCEQEWDILVIDEAHYVDGNKTWTRLIDRLIHGQNGRGTHLSRNGFVVALSGSPIMNTVADPVIIHDLFTTPQERTRKYETDVRETQGRDMPVERGLSPLRVRQALNNTLLTLDQPENWLEKVEMLDYELSPQEMEFIRAICSNSTLHAKYKLDACMQFILSPKLVSANDAMPESLVEWVKMQLNSYLSDRSSILIAENMRAKGVIRPATGEETPEPNELELHFYKRIEQYCQEWSRQNNSSVHFYTVHGKTSQAYRQIAYADAAEARRTGAHKVVIFAMSQCLNVGIRLNIDRIIALEWPYNSPELQQLLKRALREGNDDVRMTACYARGTVQQGVYDQAIDKYRDSLQCQYGTGVSDSMLQTHIRERNQENSAPNSESELFRLLLRTSPAERKYEIERWLQGRGSNGVRQFWDRHRDLFDELHLEADELGTGDMQRALSAILMGLIERGLAPNGNILDINSGGLSLEREIRRSGFQEQAHITSTDPLAWMNERGRVALHRDDQNSVQNPSCLEVNSAELQRIFQTNQIPGFPFDIGILRNLEQCNHIQSDATVHERARTLLGFLKGIRIGGKAVLPFSRTVCTTEEFESFITEVLPIFGCVAMDGWQGQIRSQDNEGDEPFRGFCVVAEKVEDVNESALRNQLRSSHLRFTHHALWANTAEGVRISNALRRPRLPYPLRHNEFRFGNRTFSLNYQDPFRNGQKEHLHTLENAVHFIKSLAETAKEWKQLPSTEKRSHEEQGILYSADLSQTVKRPTFSLKKYPGHLFFPFDPQWGQTNP